MIHLNPQQIKQSVVTVGGTQVSSVTTDYVMLDSITILSSNVITLNLRFGTLVNGVFTDNDTQVQVLVNKDGTYTSNGNLNGKISAAQVANTVKNMLTEFENNMLALGWFSGTEV